MHRLALLLALALLGPPLRVQGAATTTSSPGEESDVTLLTFSPFTFHLGFVHPLQVVALHQCLPLSSVCCFPVPSGSLPPCYVVLPSSAWSFSSSLPSPWSPLCYLHYFMLLALVVTFRVSLCYRFPYAFRGRGRAVGRGLMTSYLELIQTVGSDRLVGLVVRRPPRERKIPGSNPTCAWIFFGVESHQ